MNNEGLIIVDNGDSVNISWDNHPSSSFCLMGMDDCFNYFPIINTDKNYVNLEKDLFNSYLSFKILYISDSGKVMRSSDGNIDKDPDDGYDSIDIRCISSFKGITFSFRSAKIYDKYYLYEVAGGKYYLRAETEDFQVNSDIFKRGSIYYVEGFVRQNNEFILGGKSGEVKCELETVSSNNYLLSIIIPVYNAEKFLARCIDSMIV